MASAVIAAAAEGLIAPVPDFRYVGLEPLPARELGVAGAALALGASVTLVTSGLDHAGGEGHALFAGALASIVATFALRGARGNVTPKGLQGSVRMGIVPWGVLVHTDDAPRILRWAAVKRVEIATVRSRSLPLLSASTSGLPLSFWPSVSSRVVVETERDRFVGTAIGAVQLDRLIMHLDDYATEQATPIALDLDGVRPAESLEPECESLLVAARSWLESAKAATKLGLSPGGYRRTSASASSPRAVEVLRRILSDRASKTADPRAFAAIVAASLHATELVPELIALTQCPHPVVAAVAKQAAHKLGAARARIGTLDEVAPFLFEGDRARLDAWARA